MLYYSWVTDLSFQDPILPVSPKLRNTKERYTKAPKRCVKLASSLHTY
jgi:hypothetical protein